MNYSFRSTSGSRVIQKLFGMVLSFSIVFMVITPTVTNTINDSFATSVTKKYTAKVVEVLSARRAIIQWKERSLFVSSTDPSRKETIDIANYRFVKVGDTFDIAVTSPGILYQYDLNNNETVQVKERNLSKITYLWRLTKYRFDSLF